MDTYRNLVKYVIVVANLVAVIGGVTLMGIGLAAILRETHVAALLNGTRVIPSLFLVVGFIIFVVAILGVCGAYLEHRNIIIAHGVLLTILVIAQLALIIATFIFVPKYRDNIPEVLNDWFERINYDNMKRRVFYYLQELFNCCGTDGMGVYKGDTNLPDSCCSAQKFVPTECNRNLAHPKGCIYAVTDFIGKYKLMAGVSIAIAGVQGVGAVLAFVLAIIISKAGGYSRF